MYKFNKISFFYFALIFISFVMKAETINIAAPHWKDFTNIDGSGIYFDLIRNVYPNYTLQLSVGELPRAKRQLILGKSDIVIGVYKEELPKAYYSNWFLDTDAPVVAFHLRDKGKSGDPPDFSNKSVAWMDGFNFEKFLNSKIPLYLVKQRESGFKLLISKRIDYFIDYKDNLPDAFIDNLSFVTISQGKRLYLAFIDTPKGRKLAKQYDEMVPQLRESGKLELIFGKDYQLSGLRDFQPSFDGKD